MAGPRAAAFKLVGEAGRSAVGELAQAGKSVARLGGDTVIMNVARLLRDEKTDSEAAEIEARELLKRAASAPAITPILNEVPYFLRMVRAMLSAPTEYTPTEERPPVLLVPPFMGKASLLGDRAQFWYDAGFMPYNFGKSVHWHTTDELVRHTHRRIDEIFWDQTARFERFMPIILDGTSRGGEVAGITGNQRPEGQVLAAIHNGWHDDDPGFFALVVGAAGVMIAVRIEVTGEDRKLEHRHHLSTAKSSKILIVRALGEDDGIVSPPKGRQNDPNIRTITIEGGTHMSSVFRRDHFDQMLVVLREQILALKHLALAAQRDVHATEAPSNLTAMQ